MPLPRMTVSVLAVPLPARSTPPARRKVAVPGVAMFWMSLPRILMVLATPSSVTPLASVSPLATVSAPLLVVRLLAIVTPSSVPPAVRRSVPSPLIRVPLRKVPPKALRPLGPNKPPAPMSTVLPPRLSVPLFMNTAMPLAAL